MIYFHNNELSIVKYIDNIPQTKNDFFSQELRTWFMRTQAKFNVLDISHLGKNNKHYLKNPYLKSYLMIIIQKLRKML